MHNIRPAEACNLALKAQNCAISASVIDRNTLGRVDTYQLWPLNVHRNFFWHVMRFELCPPVLEPCISFKSLDIRTNVRCDFWVFGRVLGHKESIEDVNAFGFVAIWVKHIKPYAFNICHPSGEVKIFTRSNPNEYFTMLQSVWAQPNQKGCHAQDGNE